MFYAKIACYVVIGLILDSADITFDTTLYWCAMVILLVLDYLARREGFFAGLDAANDTLELANRILDEARLYVDTHTQQITTDKQALIDRLAHMIKDKHND